MILDSVVIGGGIAGLQAAIQLGRYEHKVVVVDAEDGRSTLCRSYHNILGYPDGISGTELRKIGRKHAEQYGVAFIRDRAVQLEKKDDQFSVTLEEHDSLTAKTVLLSTGVKDRFPDWPELKPCLGVSVYICPDCDGYEIKGKRTIIMGAGDTGANMALLLKYWSNHLIYVNHEQKPVSSKKRKELQEHGINMIEEPITRILTEADGKLRGVEQKGGDVLQAERGFLAFGGNKIESDLAEQMGIERLENQHIMSDPRSKMTNVPGVWAAGDVAVHSEQVTIAMGEGTQAAIWMHKYLSQQ